MFALVVIGIFILIISLFIYFEYRNEKKYQEERRKRSEERKKTRAPYDPKVKVQKPAQKKKQEKIKKKAEISGEKKKNIPKKSEEKPKSSAESYALKTATHFDAEAEQIQPTVTEIIAQKEKKKKEKEKNLPSCKYPKFNYTRLLDMGLSEEEVLEFVQELIPQLKTQIPLIEEAFEKEDFHSMERLTHSIKGSSTTVGTGGISDLLVECNTYLKTGKELSIIRAYIDYLIQYTEELEKQFS